MIMIDLNQYKDPVDWESVKGNLVFLGHGPQRLIAAITLYLTFVLKIGPMLMNKKQPYDLRRLVRVYNFFNIIFNIWLAARGIHLSGNGFSFFNCHCLDRDFKRYSLYVDIFIISRVIDFLDTVFFILRKKSNQITGLHVFHHGMVPMAMYLVAIFSMTPFSGFLIVVNSIVHIVMYIYYFLATFPSLVPHLWWKKYITRIQISQFILSCAYFTAGYFLLPKYCNDPPMIPVLINLGSATIFLILFLSFYAGAYKQQQPPAIAVKTTTTITNSVSIKTSPTQTKSKTTLGNSMQNKKKV